MAYDYDGKKNVKNSHYNEKGEKVEGRLKTDHGTKISTNSFDAYLDSLLREMEVDSYTGETKSVYTPARSSDSTSRFERQDALIYDGGKDKVTTPSGRTQEIHSHALADTGNRYEFYHGPNAKLESETWNSLSNTERDELLEFKDNSFFNPYKDNAKDPFEADKIANELDARAYGGRGRIDYRCDCTKCSWWYHQRCLQNNVSGLGCDDYTTEEHTCSTCSNFDATPGSTRNGDSWYGICNAYSGNPIRHSPSAHTCKAWS